MKLRNDNDFLWSLAVNPLLRTFVITLAPFAPHVCEELWDVFGHETSVCDAQWPAYNEEYLKEDTVNYTISFLLHFRLKSSFTQIMNALIDVL